MAPILQTKQPPLVFRYDICTVQEVMIPLMSRTLATSYACHVHVLCSLHQTRVHRSRERTSATMPLMKLVDLLQDWVFLQMTYSRWVHVYECSSIHLFLPSFFFILILARHPSFPILASLATAISPNLNPQVDVDIHSHHPSSSLLKSPQQFDTNYIYDILGLCLNHEFRTGACTLSGFLYTVLPGLTVALSRGLLLNSHSFLPS